MSRLASMWLANEYPQLPRRKAVDHLTYRMGMGSSSPS